MSCSKNRDCTSGFCEYVNGLSWEGFVGAFTPLSQFVLSFSFGVLFSPISWGIVFFLSFIIVWEVMAFFLYGDSWDAVTRAGVVLCTIFGWIVGRTLTGCEVIA
jgi:hypothetical protein